MIAALALGILIGVDNLRVSAGLGMLGLESRQRRGLAAAFGLCEALMPLLGLALGRFVRDVGGGVAESAGPMALGAAGFLAIYGALRGRDWVVKGRGRWLLWLLPLVLSADNLLAGASLVSLPVAPVAAALALGVISGLMALAGLALGDFAGRRLPIKAELIGGLLMIGIALAL